MSQVYQIVTDRIVEALRKGVVPWRQPWRSGFAGSGPMSLSTGKAYRGANRFLLSSAVTGFGSNWWATYRQVQERGGHVKKGEKSSIAIFWKLFNVVDKGEKKKIPFLRYHNVFNLDQTEGVALPVPPKGREFNPIEECERLVAEMPKPPSISWDGGGRCYYSLHSDSIHMTDKRAFLSDAALYATLFHELGHSTAHRSRLGRDMSGGFGSKGYAREELVAEMASAFLCAEMGIDTAPIQENESAYIASWLKALADDDKAIVWAASRAQAAADWIAGRMVEEEGEEAEEPVEVAA